MSRNMIAANIGIFVAIDEHADSSGAPLENAGTKRYIATNDEEEELLKDLALTYVSRVTPSRVILRYDYGALNVFALSGFNDAVSSAWLDRADLGGAILTAVLADLKPRIIGNIDLVRQVVDAQDGRDKDYSGHSPVAIGALFQSVRSFVGNDIDEAENDKIIFDFMLAEAELSDNWLDSELCSALRQLMTLDLTGIPFKTLARSVLDTDPASLFMALYRCLESLYAYSGASKLRSMLNIQATWETVAVALESSLGWRPTEATSLERLVAMGYKEDLVKVRDAIIPAFPGGGPSQLQRAATEHLYKLRNSVVHFRPAHSLIDLNRVDWKVLSEALINLICYSYSEIFDSI